MYRPYPLHRLHYPRLEAAIHFALALWRRLRDGSSSSVA
jgi:hypothetical protein